MDLQREILRQLRLQEWLHESSRSDLTRSDG